MNADAGQRLRAAASRALGTRPALRRAATIAWSAFLGGSLNLVVWLLLPADWFDPPIDPARLAVSFVLCFFLAAIAAFSQALLAEARPSRWGPHAR